MHRIFFAFPPTLIALSCALLLCGKFSVAQAEPAVTVTNIFQLSQWAAQNPDADYLFDLQGDVWWADKNEIILKDDTGAAELELDLDGKLIRAGERVRISGIGLIFKDGAAFRIGIREPVVDNDGVHGRVQKSGAVYLTAGRHPFRLDWFNGVEKYELSVESSGPDLPRQKIPDAALFRIQSTANGVTNFVNGLDYRCYEVSGEKLPDFSSLPALKSGTAKNFNPDLMAHAEHAGVEFSGFLETAREGLYKFFTTSDDGSRFFIGESLLRVVVTGKSELPSPHHLVIGQTLSERKNRQWVELEGKVTFVRKESDGFQLEISAGAGRMKVKIADGSGLDAKSLLNRRIRATGFCEGAWTAEGQIEPGILFAPGHEQITKLDATEPEPNLDFRTNDLPVLRSAVEVHRLKREEALRGYPVKIRGVVTSVLPEHQAFTVQDSTRGIYVIDFSQSLSAPPQIGEFLDVEGTTDPSLFAPVVNARRVTILGEGQMPEPVAPVWDQLMSGSLDAQYVEIEGIVTAARDDGVTLLTSDGVIKIDLRVSDSSFSGMKQYENALVRIRGCLFASWDYVTHQVKMGEIKIYGADIFLVQPAPADLFSTPAKTAGELRLFDPQGGAFQRVKVSGQIVYARNDEYFMMQGGKGLRFIAKNSEAFEKGDFVDVVGFPDLLGNASPVLREAVVRKTGRGNLPPPKKLSPDNLISADYDATRVQLDGILVGINQTTPVAILEMQNGVRSFVVHLKNPDASIFSLEPGSRLELVGVYAGLGGNRATGQEISSFELLMDSPEGIRVIARPPWWTLKRLLIAVGILGGVLAAAALWITQLHRKVEERTTELGAQIQERQRIEHQRALEQERSRVAQDLHDDLGAGLTEISILGKQARSFSTDEKKQNRYLAQIDEKARKMVGALDEIVWAMNPAQDSLSSLVSYFCLYADQFLGLAKIAWHLEGANELPDVAVNSLCRHELFLAFKEALNNIVRHSGATDVRIKINFENELRLSIADNGQGVAPELPPAHSDGLSNMHTRMEKLGGRFEFVSDASGTTLNFFIPAHSIKNL